MYAWKLFKNFTGTGRHFIVKHEFNMYKKTKLEVACARLLSHYQSANLTTSRAQSHYLTTFEVERSVLVHFSLAKLWHPMMIQRYIMAAIKRSL